MRASDTERDLTVDELRERFAEGRLSQDTFLYRMDAALRARERGELRELLADLPASRSPGQRLLGWLAQARLAAGRLIATSLQRPEPHAEPEALFLPREARNKFTIGRDTGCDLVLGDLTVSRYHARLLRSSEGWLLRDLSSTNGTMVNGWRVTTAVAVRAGDQVSFGAMNFVVSDRG